MDKVWLILSREFAVRVRKRSFLLTTILVPLIFPTILALMFTLSSAGEENAGPKVVMVVNENSLLRLQRNEAFSFIPLQQTPEEAKATYLAGDAFAYLHIPEFPLDSAEGITLYTGKQASAEQVSELERLLADRVRELRIESWQIDQSKANALRDPVRVRQVLLSGQGEENESNSVVVTAVATILGILIYLLVVLYGAQIMYGILEEKSSRVVEIIISSVRPMQLMTGKILGIGLVGLLQFVIWLMLLVTVTSSVTAWFGAVPQGPMAAGEAVAATGKAAELMSAFMDLPLVELMLAFLFYFIAGYFLYGAVFAAVGSAVDNIQEAQQFQFPATLPLLVGYISMFSFILVDPHSNVSYWLSILPFTSPICMIARIPFGVPWHELALSMALLVAGFFATTWLAGRIYRVGILRTGTKVSWKLLARWAFGRE